MDPCKGCRLLGKFGGSSNNFIHFDAYHRRCDPEEWATDILLGVVERLAGEVFNEIIACVHAELPFNIQ